MLFGVADLNSIKGQVTNKVATEMKHGHFASAQAAGAAAKSLASSIAKSELATHFMTAAAAAIAVSALFALIAFGLVFVLPRKLDQSDGGVSPDEPVPLR